MRNIWWVAGIGALVWVGAEARAEVVHPLTSAFQATRARPSGYSINDWTRVKPAEATNLAALADKVSQKLHLAGPAVVQNGASYQKISEAKTIAGITTRLIVERLSSGDTYLVLDRSVPHGFHGLNESQTLFRHVLQPYGRIHQDINLEGNIAGRLSLKREKAVAQAALNAVGAHQTNGINTMGYISYAGKSPFISTSDQLDGQTVNIQVAVSYNSYTHQTQVYVGAPLITVTY